MKRISSLINNTELNNFKMAFVAIAQDLYNDGFEFDDVISFNRTLALHRLLPMMWKLNSKRFDLVIDFFSLFFVVFFVSVFRGF